MASRRHHEYGFSIGEKDERVGDLGPRDTQALRSGGRCVRILVKFDWVSGCSARAKPGTKSFDRLGVFR